MTDGRHLAVSETRFEETSCQSCASDDQSQIYTFTFDDEKSSIVQCSNCNLVYTSPRPKPDALGQFYGSEYYSFSSPKAVDPSTPLSNKEALRRAILVRKLGYPSSITPSGNYPSIIVNAMARFLAIPDFVDGGKLLDVGCGSGERMLEFESFGWSVKGIEFSEDAAAAGKIVGLDIRVGSIEKCDFADASFDCITFYHSLEHVYDPLAALTAAYRLLKPGGQLLVAVPNFGSWERRIFGKDWGWLQMPTHLYHFDRKTLVGFVERAGFHSIAIQSNMNGYSVDPKVFGPAKAFGPYILKLLAIAEGILGDGKALTLTARKSTH